jgi:hypothetical protein
MDSNTTGVLAVVGMVLGTAGTLFAAANHKRIRSNCCGKKIEASLDVEETTPPTSLPPKKVSFSEKETESQ